jgi:hypothetical protein
MRVARFKSSPQTDAANPYDVASTDGSMISIGRPSIKCAREGTYWPGEQRHPRLTTSTEVQSDQTALLVRYASPPVGHRQL